MVKCNHVETVECLEEKTLYTHTVTHCPLIVIKKKTLGGGVLIWDNANISQWYSNLSTLEKKKTTLSSFTKVTIQYSHFSFALFANRKLLSEVFHHKILW